MRFILFLFLTILLSENNYKEPDFILLESNGRVEIREYGEYIVAKTSVPLKQKYSENNMFKTLASYIFGDNQKNQNIPMTAPVTTFRNIDSYDMLFYMLESDSIKQLPKPSGQNITFEKFNLGKCAVISFSGFVNSYKIRKYEKKLHRFLKKNNYTPISSFMVNRYNSPYVWPWNRRNEVLVKIKSN